MDNSIVHLILHAAPCKYEKKPPPLMSYKENN